MRPALIPVALTGETFHSFSPYVAAIDSVGNLAFQAVLTHGEEALLRWSASKNVLETVCQTGADFRHFYSHPVLDSQGVSGFAKTVSGTQGLWRFGAGESLCLVATGPEIHAIGPLGPTVNARGEIALRATLTRGEAAIVKAAPEGWKLIAVAREDIASFEGLPLVESEGSVVFRANLSDGRQGLFRQDGQTLRLLVISGEEFVSLGRFPSLGPEGEIVFAARTEQGEGLFLFRQNQLRCLIKPQAGYQSVRGGLLSSKGPVCFATPPEGNLGVYLGSKRLLGLGDELLGAEVTDFALNPVSINALGQLALRVSFSDGREGIFTFRG